MRRARKVAMWMCVAVFTLFCFCTVGCGGCSGRIEAELQSRIDDQAEKLGKLEAQIEKLEKTLSVIKGEKDALVEKTNKQAETIGSIQSENEAFDKKLEELENKNTELSAGLEEAKSAYDKLLLDTANLNMIVLSKWPRDGGTRGRRITFSHPDPEITFECATESGTLCYTFDNNAQHVNIMMCKSGNTISHSMPRDSAIGHDFIDIIIKKKDMIVGYVDLDIYETYSEYYLTDAFANILVQTLPVYSDGKLVTVGFSEQFVAVMIREAKAAVAERNKAIEARLKELYGRK